jgi:hypothetical protein
MLRLVQLSFFGTVLLFAIALAASVPPLQRLARFAVLQGGNLHRFLNRQLQGPAGENNISEALACLAHILLSRHLLSDKDTLRGTMELIQISPPNTLGSSMAKVLEHPLYLRPPNEVGTPVEPELTVQGRLFNHPLLELLYEGYLNAMQPHSKELQALADAPRAQVCTLHPHSPVYLALMQTIWTLSELQLADSNRSLALPVYALLRRRTNLNVGQAEQVCLIVHEVTAEGRREMALKLLKQCSDCYKAMQTLYTASSLETLAHVVSDPQTWLASVQASRLTPVPLFKPLMLPFMATALEGELVRPLSESITRSASHVLLQSLSALVTVVTLPFAQGDYEQASFALFEDCLQASFSTELTTNSSQNPASSRCSAFTFDRFYSVRKYLWSLPPKMIRCMVDGLSLTAANFGDDQRCSSRHKMWALKILAMPVGDHVSVTLSESGTQGYLGLEFGTIFSSSIRHRFAHLTSEGVVKMSSAQGIIFSHQLTFPLTDMHEKSVSDGDLLVLEPVTVRFPGQDPSVSPLLSIIKLLAQARPQELFPMTHARKNASGPSMLLPFILRAYPGWIVLQFKNRQQFLQSRSQQ